MVEAPKKKPGRPRKSAMEKPEQFSIRLPMLSKLMLEMIARDRNMSLSQAVEYVVLEAASNITLEGGTLFEVAREGLATLLYLTAPNAYQGDQTISPTNIYTPRLVGGHFTEAEKAVMLPDSLRTEHEKLFYEVVYDLASHHGVRPLCGKTDGLELLELCRVAQMTGMKPYQAVESWLMKYPAPEPPPRVRTAPPSGPSIPKPVKKK